jgi:hypothetical protein
VVAIGRTTKSYQLEYALNLVTTTENKGSIDLLPAMPIVIVTEIFQMVFGKDVKAQENEDEEEEIQKGKRKITPPC